MSSAVVRLLACLLMAVDHLGALFFPDEILYRIVGRLAFPLFAFLVAEGCKYTGSQTAYLRRLGLLALVSQIPYGLSGIGNGIVCNVVFTLALGVMSVYTYDKWRWMGLLLAMSLAELFKCDYGSFGVLSVFLFWFVGKKYKLVVPVFLLCGFLLGLRSGVVGYVEGSGFLLNFMFGSYAILAAGLATMYGSKRGWLGRWFFYSFYPAHLALLVGAKYLLRLL